MAEAVTNTNGVDAENTNNASNTINTNSGVQNGESIRGQIFEVGPRYTNLAYIGEGAYGMVV